MKLFLLSILLLTFAQLIYAQQTNQQTDFIVLKKNNNRTVRTYYPGAFLRATTWSGFEVNGYIRAIHNDSITFVQEEKRLIGMDFGTAIDTIYYTITINYRDIKRWHYSDGYHWGNKKGFVNIVMPKVLMIGGIGFLGLELINSAYRKESLNQGNKLAVLGVAAGVAAGGYIWNRLVNENNAKASRKYKAVYIKAGEIKLKGL